MNCTWKGCKKEANCKQIAKDGKVWANLCEEHNKELEDNIKTESVFGKDGIKKMMRVWVLAQGGAKIASENI